MYILSLKLSPQRHNKNFYAFRPLGRSLPWDVCLLRHHVIVLLVRIGFREGQALLAVCGEATSLALQFAATDGKAGWEPVGTEGKRKHTRVGRHVSTRFNTFQRVSTRFNAFQHVSPPSLKNSSLSIGITCPIFSHNAKHDQILEKNSNHQANPSWCIGLCRCDSGNR